MKLNESDLQQQYPATQRLGNPDTAAAGDAKDLRENLHNTIKVFGALNKEAMYNRLVENFSDSLVEAEELLSSEQIVKAFVEAVQSQVDYHNLRYQQYHSILDQFK
jgi:predicted metal-dependent phosphoesterase TrpH